MAELWEPTAATFAARAKAIWRPHGGGGLPLPRSGCWPRPSRPASTAPMTGRRGGAWPNAWQAAGQPYREAYARLREAEAAVRAGRRDQAVRALATGQALARGLPSAPLLRLAGELARRARLAARPRQPDPGPLWARRGLT